MQKTAAAGAEATKIRHRVDNSIGIFFQKAGFSGEH
jgi:hypothetical protein